MESTLQLVLSESQKWNLAKHCVLPIVQSHWGMKKMGYSVLCNTNGLQDFISDLHSYPVVLSIPWFHNHYKLGIILKRIKHAFLWYQFYCWKQKIKWYMIHQTWVSKLFFEEFIKGGHCPPPPPTLSTSSFKEMLIIPVTYISYASGRIPPPPLGQSPDTPLHYPDRICTAIAPSWL